MTAFRHLTEAEARTLTRAELLDRIEAEQAGLDYARRVFGIGGRQSDSWETRPGGPEGEQP
jgi:hypothetical protein